MKRNLSDLALFGGAPISPETLHVGRPNIGDRRRLMARIDEILDRNWLTNNGPVVQEFERQLAETLGVRHCIAITNGTIALEIAIRALRFSGEVIVPSFTFVATAHALQWQEIRPVFCDILPGTHCIDPGKLESLITPRTTGIIGVHLWGHPCAVDAIMEIAGKHELNVLFDASHAFACSHNGRMIGNFGHAEVFSFHATKFINTFEGGAIATNDDHLAGKIRLMKNFGFSGMDNVIYLGTNGKMNEISAAMGLTSLESMDAVIAANRVNYHTYRKELSDIPGVTLLPYDESERCNYQYIPVLIHPEEAGAHRDIFLKVLHAENIRARRYFYPGCHRMEPYRSYYPHAGLLLPETNRISDRILVLPTGTTVSPEMVTKICRVVRFVAAHGKELTRKLAETP